MEMYAAQYLLYQVSTVMIIAKRGTMGEKSVKLIQKWDGEGVDRKIESFSRIV